MDPFAKKLSTVGVSPDAERSESSPLKTDSDFSWVMHDIENWPSKTTIYSYDLETVPDDTRWPRPEEKIIEPRPIDSAVVLKTEASCKAELEAGLCEDQARELLAVEQSSKKPRKGIQDALRKHIDLGDQAMQDWKNLSKNPWSCKIVSIGYCRIDSDVPEVLLAQTEKEEIGIIQSFFDLLSAGHVRLGYNILGYDERVIFWRALHYGIKPPVKLKFTRYGTDSCIDVMLKLFNNMGDAIPLKDLLYNIGIAPPAGRTNGSHVLEMVDGAQWDAIAHYVASDAWSEMELYRRIRRVLEV